MQSEKSIKDARRKAGISQLVLCYLARVSRFRLSLAERGFIDLRIDEVERIQRTLSRANRESEAD